MAASTKSPFSWKSLSATSIASVRSEFLPKAIELPALPSVVTEFVQKSADPNFELGELARVVSKDSSLTIELLKHVNSSVFSLKTPIRNVKDALVHIGVGVARLHLLAVGVKAATRALQTKLINQRNFWNESLQKALFAREIAETNHLDPGLAFLGGLLQDYILPVLTNHFDKQYLQYMNEQSVHKQDLVAWERATFGWDHAAAGAYFAAQWHFPDDLMCAVFYHHSLQSTLSEPDAEFFKLFPVALASLLPDQLNQSPTGFQILIKVARQCRSLDLEAICRKVDEEQAKLAEGIQIPNQLSQLLMQTQRMMEQNGI